MSARAAGRGEGRRGGGRMSPTPSRARSGMPGRVVCPSGGGGRASNRPTRPSRHHSCSRQRRRREHRLPVSGDAARCANEVRTRGSWIRRESRGARRLFCRDLAGEGRLCETRTLIANRRASRSTGRFDCREGPGGPSPGSRDPGAPAAAPSAIGGQGLRGGDRVGSVGCSRSHGAGATQIQGREAARRLETAPVPGPQSGLDCPPPPAPQRLH